MEGRPVWIWAAAVALVALLIASAVSRFGPQGPSSSDAGQVAQQQPARGAIKISMANSSTKQDWLHQAVSAFHEASKRDRALQVSGRSVQVEILQEVIDGKKVDYRSGTMVTDTLAGKIKPTILSPGEESWIAQFRREWQTMHGTRVAREDAPVLVRTPMVFAMWQSRARALGCWPVAEPECTWQRIRALATNPEGWEMFGHPQWGKFKIGYGYFGESNSGTLGVAAMCMLGAGKTQGLTMDDVTVGNGCGQFIGAIEAAKVHSGKKSDWLLSRLVSGGPDYLDAALTWETEVVQLNQKFAREMREPIVAVYPQDGTIFVGHPFAILDGAPWVTADQVAAAKVLRSFLLTKDQQERVIASGLRPADAGVKLGAPIAPGYGANPEARLVPLEIPDAGVIERIGEIWHRVKKHAAVALVFDKSGSMAGGKIGAAVKGAQEFVEQMDREDRLLWLPFDTRVYPGVEGRKGDVGEQLRGEIGATSAGYNTALYDATLLAFDRLSALRQTHGLGLRYGIVVLSDGKDTSSRNTLTVLEERLRPQEHDATGIQIHTIGIGSDADEPVLKRISQAAHGRFWKGQTEKEMVAIYREIAKHY